MREICFLVAKTNEHFCDVSELVSEMYRWRGYQVDKNLFINDKSITIVSYENEELIGTFTINFDGVNGLQSDKQYSDAIDQLRNSGEKICEITKLATSSEINSKKFVAVLFSVLYVICSHQEITSILIEVNPRHEDYYKKMLGFESISNGICNRVGAPGVLMKLDLNIPTEKIKERKGRDLYKYFLENEQLEQVKNFIFDLSSFETPSEDFNFKFLH